MISVDDLDRTLVVCDWGEGHAIWSLSGVDGAGVLSGANDDVA